MADLSILQPTVLRGVIERFVTPESLTMLRRTPKSANPYPVAEWDVIGGSRTIATPNVPNSEAHIVPRMGRTKLSAALVYLREKKVFEPTTLHWLKQAAFTASESDRAQAEAAVRRELADLNSRFDNFAEFLIWRALTGKIEFNYNDVRTSVDYGFRDDHRVDASADWIGDSAAATPATLMADIRKVKELITRHGNVKATEAFASDTVIDSIFDAWAQAGASVPGAMLSDRMRDQYYSTGTLPAFMGLNWVAEGSVFDATGAAYTADPTAPYQEQRFLDEGTILFANLTQNRPVELLEGPTADDSAPQGFVGKFSKTWKEPDPSARQVLLEWNILPVVTHPDQIVVFNAGTPSA